MTTSLKEFTVTQVDGEWGWLQCPRHDCKGEFAVERKKFKECNGEIVTRACPYCFRVSLIPGRSGGTEADPTRARLAREGR